MLLFIINKIGNIDYFDEEKVKGFLNLENDLNIGENIHGWIINMDKKEFIQNLPLLNGFVNKYGFYDAFVGLDEKLLKLQSIYDIEINKKEIEKMPDKIGEIKQYIEKGNLLTNSKKEEFLNTLEQFVYLVLQNIIKIYFIIYKAVENKKELETIINSKNILSEYKAQASLLSYTSNINIEKMMIELDFMIKQLEIVSDFFYKFAKQYHLLK